LCWHSKSHTKRLPKREEERRREKRRGEERRGEETREERGIGIGFAIFARACKLQQWGAVRALQPAAAATEHKTERRKYTRWCGARERKRTSTMMSMQK